MGCLDWSVCGSMFVVIISFRLERLTGDPRVVGGGGGGGSLAPHPSPSVVLFLIAN